MTEFKLPEVLPSIPAQAYRSGWFARDAIAKADASINAVLAHPEPAGEVTDEDLDAAYMSAYKPAWERGEHYGAHYDGLRAAVALALSRRAPVQPAEGEVAKKIEEALIVVSGGLCYFSAGAKHAQLKDLQKLLTETAALLEHPQPPQPVAVGDSAADTARLDFLLRFMEVDDVGDEVSYPGLTIQEESIQETLDRQLSNQPDPWNPNLRKVIDAAINALPIPTTPSEAA